MDCRITYLTIYIRLTVRSRNTVDRPGGSTGHTPHRYFWGLPPPVTAPHRCFVGGYLTGDRTGPGFETGFCLFFLKVKKKLFHLDRNEVPERGGGEELHLQSQEGQEFSVGADTRQLVLTVHRPRYVHLCSHNFDQQNHTTTSLVRTYGNIPVIRSQEH